MWENMNVTNAATSGVVSSGKSSRTIKKQLATDFSVHNNLDVWLFVRHLWTSGYCRNRGKHALFKCRSGCFEVLEQAKYYKSDDLDAPYMIK